MRKLILTLSLFSLSLSSFAVTYYFKGTVLTNELQNVASWTLNSDGTGVSPANFNDVNDIFIVQNGIASDANRLYLLVDWDVKGKIVVGNGTGEIKLNIGQVNFKAALLDIVDNTNSGAFFQNRLVFNGDGGSYFNVILGTLASNSLVNYNGATAITQTVLSGNYANLQFGGAVARTMQLAAGTVAVSKTFTVLAGTVCNLNSGNNFVYNGTAAQTITPFNYNSLEIAGTSRTITLPAGSIGIAHTFAVTGTGLTYSLDATNIINYNGSNTVGSARQVITPFNYSNLTLTPDGRGWQEMVFPVGTIGISGSLNLPALLSFGGNTGFNARFTDGNIVNYNGADQTVRSFVPVAGDFTYKNITLSGTGTKTFENDVRLRQKLSLQGPVVAGATPVYTDGNCTLEYKATTAYTTTSALWPTPFLQTGGVIIDGTGIVTLNEAKQIGNNTFVPLTIKMGATLATNNLKLTFHGNFVREGTNTFNAGSSNIDVAGTNDDDTYIAGFTTTGTISFLKSFANSQTYITGRLPEGTAVGTFNMVVNMPFTGSDNTEVNFTRGTSSFHTSGTLTLTKGRLFLHRASVNNELSAASPQINQCGNLIMNSTNSFLSYCNLQMNQELSSIFKLTGNFTKTGGRLQGNGVASLNGNFQFSGATGTNHDVTTDNDDNGKLYQTKFQVMSGNTVTFKSDFNINSAYSGWEGFVVENGGTLDFGQLATTPFTPYKLTGGITFEAKTGSILIIRDPNGLYSGRNFNAARFEVESNPSGNLGVVQTREPYASQIQTTPGVFVPSDLTPTAFKRRFFSSGANFIFAGNGNQKTGIFQTSINNGDNDLYTVNNLEVNKTSSTFVVTGLQNFTVSNICNIAKGIFQIGESTPSNVSQTLTLNGTLTGINATDCFRSNTICDMVIGGSGALGNSIFWDQSTAGKSRGADANGSGGNLTPGVTNNVRNFTLNRTGQTITLGNEMQINNTVVPTAGTLASNNSLVMLSTQNTTSSILQLGAGASITGNVVVQSFFKGGSVASNRGFRMISNPTQATNFFQQIQDRFIVTCSSSANSPAPATGCDFRPVRAPLAQTLVGYIEGSTYVAASFDNSILPSSTAVIGKGYYFFFRGSRAGLNATTSGKINTPFSIPEDWTAAYTGTINSGDVPGVSVTRASSGAFAGITLLGNPYPATLDFTKFKTDHNEIENYISVMTPLRTGFITASDGITNGELRTSAAPGVASAGSISLQFIQPGQGFYVRKKNVGNGNGGILFKESHKATATQSPTAIRLLSTNNEDGVNLTAADGKIKLAQAKPIAAKRKLIRLSVESTETRDDATIVLEEGNDANYSGNDAPYFNNSTLACNTLTADKVNTCINFMPAVSEVKKISIIANSGLTNPNLKLNFNDLSGLADSDMQLVDSFTNTTTNINANLKTYNFGIDRSDSKTFAKNRFTLVFYNKNILPVQIGYFNATVVNTGVLLTWNTLSEQNAKNIVVESSADGITFSPICTKEVAGNSTTEIKYNHTDTNPINGTVYYRLKKVDIDGSFKYSEVKTIYFGLTTANEVKIYPNPVIDDLNVSWKNNETVNITIYDITGKMLKQFSNITKASFKGNVGDLKSGIYMLKLKGQTNNKQIALNKFVKN